MTKKSQSVGHKRQSELCLPYRKWTWLCRVEHATAKLQRPWGSSSFSPAWERRQGRRDETISLWYHFSSLADRKLSDFMVGHLQETSKLFSFPAPWLVHSSYCLQPAQDPAGAHFSSESDHWQIATLDISAATTPELCTVTARREHRNCAGHNWSWAVHYYSVAPLLALSLSAFPAALPPGLTTTVVRQGKKKKKERTTTKKKKHHTARFYVSLRPQSTGMSPPPQDNTQKNPQEIAHRNLSSLT